VPTTVCIVHAFLRLADYYRRFIRDYGTIMTPLTKLLRKGSFIWAPMLRTRSANSSRP
jgi:hypothetical protein